MSTYYSLYNEYAYQDMTDLSVENLTATNATITNATVDTADIATANIDTLNIDSLSIDTITKKTSAGTTVNGIKINNNTTQQIIFDEGETWESSINNDSSENSLVLTGPSTVNLKSDTNILFDTNSNTRVNIGTTNVQCTLPLKIDEINENSLNEGVTIDSVLLKDNKVTADNMKIGTLNGYLYGVNGNVYTSIIDVSHISSNNPPDYLPAPDGFVIQADGLGNSEWKLISNDNIDNNAGIIDTKLDQISTSGKVANSATTATNLNTGSAIVARDVNGDFSSRFITASGFIGSATALANDVLTDAMVNSAAGIQYSKLNLTNSVVAGDIDSEASTSGYVLKSDGASGASWQPDTSGSGDIVGPGSSTDGAVCRFSGPTGKLIKNSNLIVTDSSLIRAPSGTAVAPSYSFDLFNDTGMYVTGTEELSFSIAGTRTLKLFTGSQENLTMGSGTSDAFVNVDGLATNFRGFRFQTSGSNRFNLSLSATGESGSNSGSNFRFACFSDTGSQLFNALEIVRSTGTTKTRSIEPSSASSFDIGSSSKQYDSCYVNQIFCGNGTASLPSISFQNDPNSGLFRVGSDILGLSTNGTLRCGVDSGGNFAPGSNASYNLGTSSLTWNEMHTTTTHISSNDRYVVALSSNQSLSNSTETTISNWGSPSTDIGSISQSTGVFTLPNGLFMIILNFQFAGNATGFRDIYIAEFDIGFPVKSRHLLNSSGTNSHIGSISAIVHTDDHSTYVIRATQTSGGALDIVADNTFITIYRIA